MDEDRETAYHESGHCIAGRAFDWRIDSTGLVRDVKGRTGATHLHCGIAPSDKQPRESIAFLSAGHHGELAISANAQVSTAGGCWAPADDERLECVDIAERVLRLKTRAAIKFVDRVSALTLAFLQRPTVRTLHARIAVAILDRGVLNEQQIEALWRDAAISDADLRAFRAALLAMDQ
ncbi:MAG: hypothetical protein AB7O59_01055 [Pirellulales bacterium]